MKHLCPTIPGRLSGSRDDDRPPRPLPAYRVVLSNTQLWR